MVRVEGNNTVLQLSVDAVRIPSRGKRSAIQPQPVLIVVTVREDPIPNGTGPFAPLNFVAASPLSGGQSPPLPMYSRPPCDGAHPLSHSLRIE
jgi:hypothetical protein